MVGTVQAGAGADHAGHFARAKTGAADSAALAINATDVFPAGAEAFITAPAAVAHHAIHLAPAPADGAALAINVLAGARADHALAMPRAAATGAGARAFAKDTIMVIRREQARSGSARQQRQTQEQAKQAGKSGFHGGVKTGLWGRALLGD